jgi:hypothetical protein
MKTPIAALLALASLPAFAKVHAAYVLYGQAPGGKTVPMVRAIVNAGKKCPSLSAAGAPLPAMQKRTNPDPARFNVDVCEALYPTGQQVTVGKSITLPSIDPAGAAKLVVLGDSGCGSKDPTACKDPKQWPFKSLAAAAAADKPDVVIHVGDYNYRGTPGTIEDSEAPPPEATTSCGTPGKDKVYDAGDGLPLACNCTLSGPYYSQNMKGSNHPDNWKDWHADFFKPAKALLQAAPWVFVRGNHELCSRAGPGWFYLLDPNSTLLGEGAAQASCPNPDGPGDGAAHETFGAPYRVALGSLSLLVLDSANACDFGDLNLSAYQAQYATIAQLVATEPQKPAWLLSHRPMWGVESVDSDPTAQATVAVDDKGCPADPPAQAGVATGAKTLQDAMAATAEKKLPDQVKLVVAGHMHHFQALSPGTDRPGQLIVGTGGVTLGKSKPGELFTVPLNGTAQGMGLSQFGFLRIALGKDGAWSGKLKSASAKTLVECASAEPGKALCTAKAGAGKKCKAP